MDDQNWLIGLVFALLAFVLGCSVFFKITGSEKGAIIGGGVVFLLVCLLMKMSGWI
jgi:hypothetical protein